MTQSSQTSNQDTGRKSANSTHSFSMGSSDDGRILGYWQSRYVDGARHKIIVESVYCGLLLTVCPIFLFLIWFFKSNKGFCLLTNCDCNVFCRYAYAWVAGLYGGGVFVTKWLYHSVGKGFWNIDRRLWRFLSPVISSALAIVFIWMIDSALITVFDKTSVEKTPVVLTVSFLVGVFSDDAMAKMSEIASMLFGRTKEEK